MDKLFSGSSLIFLVFGCNSDDSEPIDRCTQVNRHNISVDNFDTLAKKIKLIFFVLIIILTSCSSPSIVNINDLSVEYLTKPLGVDTGVLRFSWKLNSEHRGVYQQAYQVVVCEDLREVQRGGGTVWDSGKTFSGQTVNIEYDGSPLQSNKEYYWRVRIWTDSDEYEWSEPAFFHTGLLDESQWEAEWITTQEEIIDASPLMRKEFSADKRIEKAYVFVTARGFYELYLNGEKVGDHVLDPAITDYRETVLYSTFDVTDMLRRGNNVAGAIVGNGAYNLRRTQGRYSWGSGGQSLGNPSLLMQLMITYSDGSKSNIVTDHTWKYTEGPITFNNLYGGEDYDARKEIDGWSIANFDDTGWKPVALATEPAGRLKSLDMPPLRVTKTIEPVKMLNPSPGVYLFDLGQNIAGWWRIELKGASGQVIRVRADETLNDTVQVSEVVFPKPMEEGDVLSTRTRYHTTIWTDYTLKGNVSEVYEPRFFYSGFRYIEVRTNNEEDLESLKVEGRVVRTAVERNGIFETSDSLLNRIHRAGLWSQKGNFHSYPTDCPQREKGAYLGDGQVMVEASMHDFHMAPFYAKWVNDMRDAQEENGRIPNTAPLLVGGMGGGVAWGSAYILIPWWMHNYYHDTRILEEHYPTMKDYIEHLKYLASTETSPEEPYIIDSEFYGYWFSLGEWVSPGMRDCPNHSVVHTFFFYYNSLLFSQIAEMLGYSDDANYYRALSDNIKQAFNDKFLDPETFFYGTEEEAYQTYQLIALAGDMVPDEHRESVFNTIVEDIEQRGGHLNTGIIGTKYLWPVLVQNGRDDIAFRLATQTTYPSYGYWIENNMTTFPEHWDGSSSKNHHMFGSVVEYFFKYLAGIQAPTDGYTAKGYQAIYIKPYVPDGLTYVNASYETVTGEIFSSWSKDGNSFSHTIEIPANTNATVALPVFDFGDVSVWEGDSKIWENNSFVEGTSGIVQVNKEMERVLIHVESGRYEFRVERN